MSEQTVDISVGIDQDHDTTRHTVAATREEIRRLTVLVHRPWEHSTGPRTRDGKRRVSINSQKHGARSTAHLFAIGYVDAVLIAFAGRTRPVCVRPSCLDG